MHAMIYRIPAPTKSVNVTHNNLTTIELTSNYSTNPLHTLVIIQV
jgi:hypothetical protein